MIVAYFFGPPFIRATKKQKKKCDVIGDHSVFKRIIAYEILITEKMINFPLIYLFVQLLGPTVSLLMK